MQNYSQLPVEIEFKIALEKHHYLQLCAAWDPPVQVLRQHNYFFTSPSLHKARLALRLRHQNQKYFLTCKGPVQQLKKKHSATQRMELETELTVAVARKIQNDPARLGSLDNPVSQFLRSAALLDDLRPWLSFKNLRKSYAVKLLQRRHSIELDHSVYSRDADDYELELELCDEDLATSAQLFSALQKTLRQLNVPLRTQSKGKLARAIAAQRGT